MRLRIDDHSAGAHRVSFPPQSTHSIRASRLRASVHLAGVALERAGAATLASFVFDV